jgi:proteasome accessory factor A
VSRRLLGIETEYGFAGPPERDVYERSMCLDHLLGAAKRRYRHLNDFAYGIFLENGSRLYIDCGHPEMATPECANPWEVVRYVIAGERMLEQALADVERHEYSKCSIIKSNDDYSGTMATWGCHGSYLHCADPA